MKKVILILALALSGGAPAALADKEDCHTEIERSSNPILEIITIPFKMVAAFSHLPRCIVAYFPVNEPKDE
ncbi:MAG: hypothetical protein ACR2P5_01150 [Gammaproteobacteria bacterium]